MARGIQLRRYAIAAANHWYLHGFRLRVEVQAVAGGMDPNVFLYRRNPPDPVTGEVSDVFQTVCSFPDMGEYPATEPSDATAFPYFRLDFVELDFRGQTNYDSAWTSIRTEVHRLVAAMDKAEDLVVVEDVWLGDSGGNSESA